MWRPLIAWLVFWSITDAATIHTDNFIVQATDESIANNVAIVAEEWRSKSAKIWLDTELPTWKYKCPITVRITKGGSGGETTYRFIDGNLKISNMKMQGTPEGIIDAVIPHEVNHAVFATHFKRPIPRWADEGAAAVLECESEHIRYTRLLTQSINTNQYIPIDKLLGMDCYPANVLVLYAEGYSLVDFLVDKKDHTTFVTFLEDARSDGWEEAIEKHYEYESIAELERAWKQHVTTCECRPAHLNLSPSQ